MDQATPRLAFPLLAAFLAIAPAGSAPHQGGGERVDFEVSEGTKLAVDVSPDGRMLVFDLLGQVWLLPAGGGKARALTDAILGPSEDSDPTFAPDGRWIAFAGRRPGGRGLWLVPSGGGTARRLTSGESADPEPAWSPDSSRLAFVRGGKLLTIDISTGSTTTLRVEGMKAGAIRSPTWSPDGRQLAFVQGWAGEWLGIGPDPGGQLYVVPSEGGTASRLLGDGPPVSRPAFSPEGARLAYFTWDARTGSQLWIADLARQTTRRVEVHGDLTTRRLRWFPDGRSLLYVADGRFWRADLEGRTSRETGFTARVELTREHAALPPVRVAAPGSDAPARGLRGLALSPDGRSIALIALQRLWVFRPGAEPRAVTEVPLDAKDLTWSPDGAQVAWCAGPVNAEDIFATEVRSGRTRRLTQLPGGEFRPSWSPDGQQVGFIYGEKGDPTFAPLRLRTVPARGETVRTAEGTRDLTEVTRSWHNPMMFHGHEIPQWSPDAKAVLLFDRTWYGGQNKGRLVALAGETRDLQRFPVSAAQIRWAGNGTLVYVDNDQLFSTTFEPDRGTTSEPVLLWDGPAIYPNVSRDGTVLFVSDDGFRIRWPNGVVQHLGWPLRYHATAPPPPMLVHDVWIVSGGQAPAARSDILIQDGRIRRIAPSGTITVDRGVRIVRGDGRWAIPGLIDASVSLCEPALVAGLLYHGVTTLRDMGSQIGLTADLRDSIDAGYVQGPRIFFSGFQFFPGADPAGVNTGDLWHVTAGDAGAVRGLALAKGFGASSAFLYQAETLEAAERLIRLAHKSGLRVTYARLPPLSFVAAGIDETMDTPTGEVSRDDAVQLLRASGVILGGNITYWSLFGHVQSNPSALDAPDTAPFVTPFLRGYGATRVSSRRPFYDTMASLVRGNVARSYQAGVAKGVEGAGVQPVPWALHAELEELVKAGLSAREALEAATLVNARILGAEGDIGSIEEGKVADLVLLGADPIADIRNTRRIHAVVQGGRLVDREALLLLAKRHQTEVGLTESHLRR